MTLKNFSILYIQGIAHALQKVSSVIDVESKMFTRIINEINEIPDLNGYFFIDGEIDEHHMIAFKSNLDDDYVKMF